MQWLIAGRKRIIVALLVSLFALAGVGNAAERIEIEIWGNAGHMDALKPIVEEFNTSHDRIHVSIPGKKENPESILGAQLAGNLPAIIEGSPIWDPLYAKEGLSVDLTPFIEREPQGFLGDFAPIALKDHMVDGRLYGLPAVLQIMNPYYNPEVLSASGVEEPKVGWTWDDLKSIASKALRVRSDGQKESWGIIAEGAQEWDWPMIGMAGGRFVTDDLQVVSDSDAVRRAYLYTSDLLDLDLIEFTDYNTEPGLNWDVFGHKAAFYVSASYRANTIRQNESALRASPPLRADSGSKPTTFQIDRSWSIMNVSPEKQEAAWEVLKYLLKPENNARWLMTLGYPPATLSTARYGPFEEYMQADPSMQMWTQRYMTLDNAVMWPNALYSTDIRSTRALSEKFITGEWALEAFITNLTDAVKQSVDEYKSMK